MSCLYLYVTNLIKFKLSAARLGGSATLGVAHRSKSPPSAVLKVQIISTLTSVAAEL